MNWSKYQLGVFEATQRPGNKFVRAVAGSGKTTVIEEDIKRKEGSVIAVAFNKHIAVELGRRLDMYPHIRTCTLNSFGNSVIREHGWAKVNEDKVQNILFFDIFGGKKASQADKKVYYKVRHAICKVASLCKAFCFWQPTKEQVESIVRDFDINLPNDMPFQAFFDLFSKTYALNWDKKVIDWDDQIAYPLRHNMEIPTYDFVYVDEAQDLSVAQRELTVRMCAEGGQLIYVGDPRQAIYQFRGADENSVDEIISTLNCTVLPLSICYRCAKAIVRQSQTLVPDIEYHPDAPEGVCTRIEEATYRSFVHGGDVILCRCTAPLVTECLRLIREGETASVKGRDFGTELLECIPEDVADGTLSTEFNESLVPWIVDKQKKHPRTEQNWQDKLDTLQAFYGTCPTVGEIRKRIATIFEDKQDDSGIRLMTIHKSKGLENERIFNIRPDLLPHPRSTDKEAETNLQYVAWTRAKLEYYDVDSPERQELS